MTFNIIYMSATVHCSFIVKINLNFGSVPRPSAPITVHKDGSQQQFSTVKYSSTTPLNSTSSLTGTWVTLVTVMNTCKICQILVKGNSAGVDGGDRLIWEEGMRKAHHATSQL